VGSNPSGGSNQIPAVLFPDRPVTPKTAEFNRISPAGVLQAAYHTFIPDGFKGKNASFSRG
jgi:hypothetical protein